MKADFKSDFSKTQTCFQKPKSGEKNMEPSWNRIRFNLENWWTTTTIPRSFKILVEVPFENGAFRVRHYCFQPTLE